MTSNNQVQEYFPKRLQALMKETNTTQQVLADSIGIKRQSISQYVDGSILPTIEKLNNMAEFFHVSADYLLGRTDIKTPEIEDIAIHKVTGLSEKVIGILKEAISDEFVISIYADMVNDFVTSESFPHLALLYMELVHLRDDISKTDYEYNTIEDVEIKRYLKDYISEEKAPYYLIEKDTWFYNQKMRVNQLLGRLLDEMVPDVEYIKRKIPYHGDMGPNTTGTLS